MPIDAFSSRSHGMNAAARASSLPWSPPGAPHTRADFTRLVEVAYADLCHQTNPRKCAKSDFEALFAAAL